MNDPINLTQLRRECEEAEAMKDHLEPTTIARARTLLALIDTAEASRELWEMDAINLIHDRDDISAREHFATAAESLERALAKFTTNTNT